MLSFDTQANQCVDPTVHSCIDTNGNPLLATGDGVTNDQPALQCTLDRLASQGGGTVCLPAGTFRVMSMLSLRGRGLTLKGNGSTKTVIIGDAGAGFTGGLNDNVVLRVGRTSNISGTPFSELVVNFSIKNLGIVGKGNLTTLGVTNASGMGEISHVGIVGNAATGFMMDVCGGVTVNSIDIGNADVFPPQFNGEVSPTRGIRIGTETANIRLQGASITNVPQESVDIFDASGGVFGPKGIVIDGGLIRTGVGGTGIAISGLSSTRQTGPVTITGTVIETLYA
ncbi:MAG: hypothetical protein HY073_03785, partial [Deltaproteobacteria bacterium]|nr:hypothetical protein [Deltaproteobacteria bacterium]